MDNNLLLIYEILVDFDNRNPSTLFFPGDLRENDAQTSDVLGLIAKIWEIEDAIAAIKSNNQTLEANAKDAEKILELQCNFDSKIYEVTDNIIVEKFDAQPTLLGQLLDNLDNAIASLNKFQFTDAEISQTLKMQVEQVLGESEKVIKQNPNDYDYTQRRIESPNAEDIIKFDGGLDKLLEYAKSLLTRKNDWYIHLIAVKVKRILDTGCKYENNKFIVTDDKLICKVVEGDFTAIANKPTDLLKKLVDWKIKEYGKEETDPEIEDREGEDNKGESKKLDCRDFPVNAQAFNGRPSRSAIIFESRLGKGLSQIYKQNNRRFAGIQTFRDNTKEVSFITAQRSDAEEIIVLPIFFDKSHTLISWGDRIIQWSNGQTQHTENLVSFNARTGAIASGRQSSMYIHIRLPVRGKFAFYKHGWNQYSINSTPWDWQRPTRNHFKHYNPSGRGYTGLVSTQQNGMMGVFDNLDFPGAVFIIPRLSASYSPQGKLRGQPPYNIYKSGYLAYASISKNVDVNNIKRTGVVIRAYKMGSFSKHTHFNHCLLYLGSTKPLMEAFNYDARIKPRIRLYSDINGDEFLCCSHDEDREIFKVDFSKETYPYNTIEATDRTKNNGQYGFTCVQVHLPPEKQNVYPLVEHVLSSGNGASFRFWDARTGQELRDRFPISVLSVQHH